MKLTHLLNGIQSLIEQRPEAAEFEVVFRTCHKILNDDDEALTVFKDNPIYAEVADFKNKEYALIDFENWPIMEEFLNIPDNEIENFDNFTG